MTDLTTPEILLKTKSLGASSISISPDSASSRPDDSIRGKAGTFQKAIEIIQTAVRTNLNPPVNTAIMKRNFRELPDISPDQKPRDQHMGAFLSDQDRKWNRC